VGRENILHGLEKAIKKKWDVWLPEARKNDNALGVKRGEKKQDCWTAKKKDGKKKILEYLYGGEGGC